MIIKDCVKSAAECLAISAIVNFIDDGDELSTSEQDEFDTLCSCARACMHEIATEYVPIICIEEIEVVDGKISYDMLSNTAIEIIEVKKDDCKVKISSYYNGVCLNEIGVVEVKYHRLPNSSELDDELEWKDSRINSRNIGYGIASEYCIRNGMLDDAVMWDKRYKDSLSASILVNRELNVKRRRWL